MYCNCNEIHSWKGVHRFIQSIQIKNAHNLLIKTKQSDAQLNHSKCSIIAQGIWRWFTSVDMMRVHAHTMRMNTSKMTRLQFTFIINFQPKKNCNSIVSHGPVISHKYAMTNEILITDSKLECYESKKHLKLSPKNILKFFFLRIECHCMIDFFAIIKVQRGMLN